jgi:hypothetical protein
LQKIIKDEYCRYWKKLYVWEEVLMALDDPKELEERVEPLYEIVHQHMDLLVNNADIVITEEEYEALRKEAWDYSINYILDEHRKGNDVCKMVW